MSASDDEQHNATFESADAGSSLTFPMQCSALRKNGHVVIKGRPCKVSLIAPFDPAAWLWRSLVGVSAAAKQRSASAAHIACLTLFLWRSLHRGRRSQRSSCWPSAASTPSLIIDMSTSKTGKHGHAKVHLVATDIFTSKKYEDISPSTHNMDVPNVSRNEFQLVNIDDGYLNLMTNDGDTKDDVRVPDGELGEQIQAAFDDGKDLMVTIVSAMGEEHCLSFKDAPQGK
ncbi:translation initiation factor 5A [Moesziomyces antarcticus T-34]|uniref:Translation initiation factor 5A n=1 Tax=Pseudozyma antarctica (strain T-34) TaxID=1151754 RepID=M9LWJ3_PSEA3|nr:translation initiation factor 5A [Moesziomyces antarcticus T-34]